MASNFSQARDGRMSLAFILEPESSPIEGTGALSVGDMGFILAKASSGAFKDLKVNSFFIANKSTTLTSGDKFVKCKALFLGQATSKSVSMSKNVTDVTIDYDGATNNVTDGTVSSSGSISGSYVTESLKVESGVNLLKSRFSDIVEIDAEGAVTKMEADTTNKDILLIIWNGRNAKVGDMLEMEVIPALFSNLSKDGSYNSSQTFNVDYTGNFSDENGYIGGIYQVVNAEGLMPSIVRPVA
jgi:hypothetical protein